MWHVRWQPIFWKLHHENSDQRKAPFEIAFANDAWLHFHTVLWTKKINESNLWAIWRTDSTTKQSRQFLELFTDCVHPTVIFYTVIFCMQNWLIQYFRNMNNKNRKCYIGASLCMCVRRNVVLRPLDVKCRKFKNRASCAWQKDNHCKVWSKWIIRVVDWRAICIHINFVQCLWTMDNSGILFLVKVDYEVQEEWHQLFLLLAQCRSKLTCVNMSFVF